MLKHLIAGCFACLCMSAQAQLLFTYGNDTVTTREFLAAYTKNNTGSSSKEAVRTYLDLYIASRLKIKEAKARRYDTLPQITTDLASLREQIVPSYMKDEAAVNRLAKEAMMRAAKDIHLQHIFIAFDRNGKTDTTAAQQQAHEVLKKLEGGEPFTSVASEFSEDPAAKRTGGDAGYVTVFTLPYAIETLLYSTPPGKITPLYKSRSGYHIFKNAGERPALGSVKAAQILIALPPDANAGAKARAKRLADSLYTAVMKGANFGKLATKFSNDVVSAQAEGNLPLISTGDYDSTFENAVFALPTDGAVTKPFLTAHGYHIVKRLGRIPVPTDTSDAKAVQAFREKVEASDRMGVLHEALTQKILKEASFKKQAFRDTDLWVYSDSILNEMAPPAATPFTDSTTLFTIGTKAATVADWITHAETFRFKNDGSGVKSYPLLWDEFVQASAMAYYKDHLEQFNETFRQQLEEFRDGNLFFEIMQEEVWNKAQEDTAALRSYYEAHKQNYLWQKSADAVIFYTPDASMAKKLMARLQKTPAAWKKLAGSLGENIATDSARYELSQIPNGANQALQKGTITQPVINEADSTASFALILKTYNNPSQRTFTEAKGLVVTDYQAALEKAWIADLKKKYPVVVNEAELAKL